MKAENMSIKVNIEPGITLWQALKFRIAGGKYMKEFWCTMTRSLNDTKSESPATAEEIAAEVIKEVKKIIKYDAEKFRR